MLDYQNLSTLQKTKGAIGNEQSRENDNSGHRTKTNKAQKHNTEKQQGPNQNRGLTQVLSKGKSNRDHIKTEG